MMTDPVQLFGRRYHRFLCCMAALVRVVPRRWQRWLAYFPGRLLSPFNASREAICTAAFAALPAIDRQTFWHRWRDNHLAFILDFLNYRQLDQHWLHERVRIENPDLLSALQQRGGLLLTAHGQHQNTLCCALGLAGCKVSAVAADPEDSPLFPLIGRWAKRVNTDSATHFRGGRYMFTSRLRALLRDVRAALAEKQVVVCLIDVNQGGASVPAQAFFGRAFRPPTGVLELALRDGAPVFAALFFPVNGRLTLKLQRLDNSQGLPGVLSGYLAFLVATIQDYPYFWQGWEWFAQLPTATYADADHPTSIPSEQ